MNGNGAFRESELLHTGGQVKGMDLKPESVPLFLTTAFTMNSLTEVMDTYANKGYTYVRTRNPNRAALAEAISYLENGEKSLIFSSGMGAITSTLMSLIKAGDHILCNSNIYGETFLVMTTLLNKFGVEVDLVNFEDLEIVSTAIKPNTKMLFTEVVSNPTLSMCDIRALAGLAHANGALLMVDNTFTTPIAIRPLDLGADIVMNSLTKFINGHSDAMGGSITSTEKIVDTVMPVSMLCGTPGDPFDSWLIFRSIHTLALRMPRQMESAARLAQALRENPLVSKVNHPSLHDYPQKELAARQFGPKGVVAMFSFIVPEKTDRMDAFLQSLRLTSYAPTLGGIRTTLQHPVTSSHPNVPDDIRRAMGITPGMFRVSVGLEEPDDLIADFNRALDVFKD
ncbi:aminotransferase class I/II-fold pyridoxal phosphate-dependent enzyme [Deltaproteobacteria bacterium OttesenSCG-928-M10]|nr:aminotransferase class I/II-fold pyridoxal phosphate-dependent enzyme [Deltaproteobacteria bacterium OttesenSCG-928-M10]